MRSTRSSAAAPGNEQLSQDHLRIARLLFLAATVVFAITTGFLLRRPLLWLLGVVADDGFYYFKIATNLVHTGRSTFDGINPTNGYHPVWMLLTVACASVVDDKELLLRLVLGLGFVLHYLGTLLLIKTLAKLTSEYAAWIAGAVWLLNPFAQVLLLQGLEAPIFLLSLVVVLHVYWSRIEPRLQAGGAAAIEIPTRHAAFFGAALGFACLARTEAVIGCGLGMALIAVALWKRGHRVGPAVRFTLTAGAVWSLVCTPWLVFSWITVGGLAQDSGTMKLLWGAEQFAKEGMLFRIHYTLFIIFRVWLDMPLALSALVRARGLCAGLVLPPLCLAVLVYRRREGAEGLYRTTIGLGAAVLATGVVCGAMLGDLQVWHLVQPAFALFLLCLGWSFQAVRAHATRGALARLRLCGCLVLAGVCVLHLRGTFEMQGRYPWQRDAYASQNTFEAIVPPGEVIGAFNAGIPGYLGNRRIINLDGLANHAAVAYWKGRDFAAYLEKSDIRYVLDERTSLDRALRFSRSPIDLKPLHEVKLTGWSCNRVLWRVTRP